MALVRNDSEHRVPLTIGYLDSGEQRNVDPALPAEAQLLADGTLVIVDPAIPPPPPPDITPIVALQGRFSDATVGDVPVLTADGWNNTADPAAIAAFAAFAALSNPIPQYTRLTSLPLLLKGWQPAVGPAVVGDGIAADTVGVQDCVNVMIASGSPVGLGRHRIWAVGSFKITAEISIGVSSGWTIEGLGGFASSFVQATDNTPIFHLTGDDTFDFQFVGIRYRWANQQAAATASLAVAVCGSTVGNTGVGGLYQFSIRRCVFSNGYAGLRQYNTNTALYCPMWGLEMDDCRFENNWRGPAVRLLQDAAGQPNIVIKRVYVRADLITQAPVIDLSAYDAATLLNVEVNNAVYLPIFQFTTCTTVKVISCRSEGGTLTGAFGGLVVFSGSQGNVIGFQFARTTVNVPGSAIFVVRSLGTSSVHCTNLSSAAITLTAGAWYGVQADATARIFLHSPTLLVGATAVMYPSDSTSTVTVWIGRVPGAGSFPGGLYLGTQANGPLILTTLVNGTVTVNHTGVKTATILRVTRRGVAASTALGNLIPSAIVDSTSFTIQARQGGSPGTVEAGDQSPIAVELVQPA